MMDIQLEKAAIIKRLEEIEDESLILALKNLLDFALKKDDRLLAESVARGLEQSRNRQVKSHRQVMADVRAKYKT